MKKIDLVQAVQILANVGVIAGIVFLGLELRQNTIVSRLEVVQSYSDNLTELEYFIARDESIADLLLAAGRNNGNGFNDLPPPQQLRLLGFWRAQLREWDTAYYILNVTDTDPQLVQALREQIADILSNSPNMYRQWRDSPRYTDVFNDLMEELAIELSLE